MNGTGTALSMTEFDSASGNFFIEFNTGALVGDMGWEIEFSTSKSSTKAVRLIS